MSESGLRYNNEKTPNIEEILASSEVLIAAMQKKCEEMREAIIDAHDFSLLPGLVLREIIVQHADALPDAELKAAKLYIEQLERVMGLDELTQVWNRKMLNHDLSRIWNIYQRSTDAKKPQNILAVVDVDHFKRVNTLGGLPAGDQVLKELVRLMNSVCQRSTDRVYRYGGEEFVVIMEHTTPEHAQRLLEALRQLVQQELLANALQHLPDSLAKTQLASQESVTVSVGYVSLNNQKDQREWFDQADSALYAAKKGSGSPHARNQVRQFEPSFTQSHAEQEAEVAHASPVSIREIIIEHLPLIDRSNKEIHDQYIEQGNLLPNQPHTPVQIDPRRGMEKILCQIAYSVGSDTAYTTDLFQVAESAMRYIESHAYRDALTQLPNVKAFYNDCRRLWSEMAREGQPHALFVFDIDFFKAVNDSFGHDVGDLVLRAAARVLKRISREGESIARIGGEEFALLVPFTYENDLEIIAERLRGQFEEQVLQEVRTMCAAQGMRIDFNRSAFTITIGVQTVVPVAHSVGETFIYQMPTFEEVKHKASEALNIGKGIGAIDPESLGYRTSRPGPSGRNRWVIMK